MNAKNGDRVRCTYGESEVVGTVGSSGHGDCFWVNFGIGDWHLVTSEWQVEVIPPEIPDCLQEATNRALQAERTIANLASHMESCRPCR